MKLISFSVENYRSIRKTQKLPIRQLTVLIGPNNEGKSNILRALTTSLRILSSLEDSIVRTDKAGHVIIFNPGSTDYDWRRDFPVSLQGADPEGQSSFDLEFVLDSAEIAAFRKEVRSNLNGALPVRVTVGKDPTRPTFRVMKRGRGSHSLSQKADHIAGFIAKRLRFGYVPAVRTAHEAREVVEDMVAAELALLEKDPAYVNALKAIATIQQPVLGRISDAIRETLRVFIPTIRSVDLNISDKKRYRALHRSIDILVNDGTPTNLDLKGDGVQSLAALAMLRHASEEGAGGRHLVLSVEEPESHLHPRAIHQLKKVLQDIASKQHQVILTTHCPIFVDRRDLTSNIIVTNNKAGPARDVVQLRGILGVRASDNLRHAELVLVVEGEDDKQALLALLSHASTVLSGHLANGTLAIESMVGSSNLSYRVSEFRHSLCEVHAFLDNDQAARSSARRAETEGLLSTADITYATCLAMTESELEDMYNSDLYQELLRNNYNVALVAVRAQGGRKKWTTRMRELFLQQGQPWDDRIERELKRKVTECVLLDPARAINPHLRGPLDALIATLERKLAPPSTSSP